MPRQEREIEAVEIEMARKRSMARVDGIGQGIQGCSIRAIVRRAGIQ
ncbi:hypothetical protein X740_21635 [Mesorhizobium sp. LNHC221B00]|nr:hypothetical protein X740_21635 [Mesorhizobium sp. LNHC221B00]